MLLLILVTLTTIVQSELRWTQYSDRASMPKSKRERDRLRELLSKVNEAYLTSSEDKRRFADLQAIFAADDVMEAEADRPSDYTAVLVGLAAVTAVALYLYRRPVAVFDEQARQLRLNRFTSTCMCCVLFILTSIHAVRLIQCNMYKYV